MGKIAFVFPGQGAQFVGMGKELYERFNCVRRIFDAAGEDVKSLSFEGSPEVLNLTLNAQPCLFAMDLACAAALNEGGVYAEGLAGFSLGEVPAIVHSGLMSLEQGLDFVRLRARVMNECAERVKGCMFAVLRLSTDEVVEICETLEGAYPVNFNCSSQTVVACSDDFSEKLQKSVAGRGGKAVRLAVSGAFHSPLMSWASEKTAEYLESQKMEEMNIPVYSNVTARIYDSPKELLARQINSPVLWQKTIENMIADGFDIFIEVGAGKTLSGLIRKIDGGASVFNVCDAASLENTVRALKDEVGKNAER